MSDHAPAQVKMDEDSAGFCMLHLNGACLLQVML